MTCFLFVRICGRKFILVLIVRCSWASQVVLVVKNLLASTGETQEMRVQSPGWEDPLEKGMATHSSILAWKIPWTEEPDRLQSITSQRVGHD